MSDPKYFDFKIAENLDKLEDEKADKKLRYSVVVLYTLCMMYLCVCMCI